MSKNNKINVQGIEGINLRDYFAAKAMQAIIANPDAVAQMCSAVQGLEPTDVVPIAAYGMADGMLKVREEYKQ